MAGHGDFVSRGLSPQLVSLWDDWLAARMHELPRELGDDWLNVYLTSPILRFVLPRRLLGWPVVGILMPSVDRVGRYYPLLVASELPAESRARALALRAAAWFDQVEGAALETLADAPLTLDALADRLSRLPFVDPAPAVPAGEGALPLAAALADLGGAEQDGAALWWVNDSFRFCLAEPLPDTATLAWLMGGGAVADPSADSSRAAGRTHSGHVRSSNQDAILVDAARGLYAVADGMGGHLDGARASRVLTAALAAVPLDGSFDERVAAVRHAIEQVNRELYEFGLAAGDVCGATIVALLLGRERFAVLWAGDSRAYRLPASGDVEPLTRDHGHPEGGVSRACGAAADIELDLAEGRPEPGDRFLLCSDGVYRHLDVRGFLTANRSLRVPDLVDAVVAEVLESPADDNLSVVVAQASLG